jgi:IstB-like ATP binding protein
VDEVGYLTYGTGAANMLFHLVNERHRRRRSMIFTTNKPLAAWGRVLHDEDLAQPIVSRVLERGRLLTLDGPSIRTRHLGLDDVSLGASNHGGDTLARISGIPWPEFPEPTGLYHVDGRTTSWLKIKNPDYSQLEGRFEHLSKGKGSGTARSSRQPYRLDPAVAAQAPRIVHF